MSIKIYKKEWLGGSGIEWIVGKAYSPSQIRAFYFDLGRVARDYDIPDDVAMLQEDGLYRVIWTPELETEWCVGDRIENQKELEEICSCKTLEISWGKDRKLWPKWFVDHRTDSAGNGSEIIPTELFPLRITFLPEDKTTSNKDKTTSNKKEKETVLTQYPSAKYHFIDKTTYMFGNIAEIDVSDSWNHRIKTSDGEHMWVNINNVKYSCFYNLDNRYRTQ